MPSCHLQRAVLRILVQPSIVMTHPSDMQRLRIELLPRSHDLPACNYCPHIPVFSPAAFCTRSCRMLNRSSNNPVCRSHVGRYRPFSSQPLSLSCSIDISGHSSPILCYYIELISALTSQIMAADDAVDIHLVSSGRRADRHGVIYATAQGRIHHRRCEAFSPLAFLVYSHA